MTLTGPDVRILQVHPTRFCNLRCQHCYSSSGPEERSQLPIPLLRQSLADAASLGYNVLSVSGGEPLLYRGLPDLCEEARKHRMLVTLVTNGTLLNEARVEMLAGSVDALAISIDGNPERHDRVRGLPGSFRIMERRLPLLRRAQIPFGFVFTLTRQNLAELEWAADFAVAQGARMLQVHPVEQHGRAVAGEELSALNDQELSLARLVLDCLKQIYGDRLFLQLDALDQRHLPVSPESIMEWQAAFVRGEFNLGEIVSPLVIEDDATVVPLRYGFPRNFALGSLHRESLLAMSTRWQEHRSEAFCRLYQRMLERALAASGRFSNIYGDLADEASLATSLVFITD